MQADKAKVSTLIKTARGQLDGILRMIEQDRYCMDIPIRYWPHRRFLPAPIKRS